MGELIGGLGTEIEAIGCDGINSDVIETDAGGQLSQTRVGRAVEVKPGVIRNAPDGCPLTLPKELREIGSFTVCLKCPNSTLVSDGLIEC